MARRVTRLTPAPRIPQQIRHAIARGQSQANRGMGNRQPARVPVEAYTRQARTPITGGYQAAVVPASGTVTVKVGPMGLGTVWYPQAVAISTTTGANDTSTCALYLTGLTNGGNVPSTQIGGQSDAGGGDTIGVAVPPMWPGYFIVAVWTGATHNDLAAVAVYGEQDTLHS